jgi:hypothetical protein
VKRFFRTFTEYAVLLFDSWRYAREESRERTLRHDRRRRQ